MRVRSLGWENSLEECMATHSSIFAWRIPWTEDPGRPQSIGSHRVGYNHSILACTQHLVLPLEAWESFFIKQASCQQPWKCILHPSTCPRVQDAIVSSVD